MDEAGDSGDGTVDPMVVQSLADFKVNCQLLQAAVANESAVFNDEMVKVWSWIQWISDGSGDQHHTDHFFKHALPMLTKTVLNRTYSDPAADIPKLMAFLQRMLAVVAQHVPTDVEEVWAMFATLLNPENKVYKLYGQTCVPPPPPQPEGYEEVDENASWIESVPIGGFVNFDLGGLVKAKVEQFSPPMTEVQVSFPDLGGATEWLSVTDERLTPLAEPEPAESTQPTNAPPADGDETPVPVVDPMVWREALAVGDVCDCLDNMKSWYEALIVEEKSVEVVAAEQAAAAALAGATAAAAAVEGASEEVPASSSTEASSTTADAGVGPSDATGDVESETESPEGTPAAPVRHIKVSFIGWSTQYDAWLPITSHRLAPLRSRAHGKRGNGTVYIAETEQTLRVDDEDDPNDRVAVIRPYKSQHLVDLLSHFCMNRGLGLVLERLRSTEKRVPINQLRLIINALGGVSDLFCKSFAAQWFPHLLTAMRSQLQAIDEQTLRVLSAPMVGDMVRNLRKLCRRIHTPRDTGNFVELLHLDVGLQCFKANLFQRRLNGLAYIQHCVNMTQNTKLSPTGIQVIPGKSATGSVVLRTHMLETAKFLTPELMANFINSNNLIRDVFVDRPHDELMKRILPTMKFLASEDRLSKEDLHSIYAASVTSHDPTIEAVFKLLGDVASDLSVELQQELFTFVKNVRPNDLTQRHLDLLRDLAAAAKSPEGPCLAAAELLWEFVQDGAAGRTVASLAEKSLQSALANARFDEWKIGFTSRCIANIKASRSSVQSLELLKSLLGSASAKGGEGGVPSKRATWIQQLNESDGLLEAMFADLKRYNDAALLASAGLEDDAIASMLVGDSSIPHKQQVSVRVNMLGYVTKFSALEASKEQAAYVWQSLGCEGLTEDDRGTVTRWFLNVADNLAKEDYSFCSAETAIWLFHEHMADPHCKALGTKTGFQALRRFFLFVNSSSGKLDARNLHNDFTIVDLDLDGLDAIWATALTCEVDVTAMMAERFLTALPKKLQNPAVQLGPYRRNYVSRCMELLQPRDDDTPDASERRLNRSVGLLTALVDAAAVETVGRVDSHGAEARGDPMTITVNNSIVGSPTKGHDHKVVVYSNQRVYHLVAAIADELGHHRTSMRLMKSSLDISKKSSLRKTLTSLVITDKSSVTALGPKGSKKAGETAEESPEEVSEVAFEDIPSVIIAHNPEYFHTLLDCLDGVASPSASKHVWDLLLRLPTNPHILEGVRTLAGITADKRSWRTVLDDSSDVKLLYSLQIVETLLKSPAADNDASGEVETKGQETDTPGDEANATIQPADAAKEATVETDMTAPAEEVSPCQVGVSVEEAFRSEWRIRFMRLGGFEHLLTLLMEGPLCAHATTDLGKTAVALLLRIVRFGFSAAVAASAGVTDDVLSRIKLISQQSTGTAQAPAAAKPVDKPADETLDAEAKRAAQLDKKVNALLAAISKEPEVLCPPADSSSAPMDPEALSKSLGEEAATAALAAVNVPALHARLKLLLETVLGEEPSKLDAHIIARALGLWEAISLFEPSSISLCADMFESEFLLKLLLCAKGDGALGVRLHTAYRYQQLCLNCTLDAAEHPGRKVIQTLLANVPAVPCTDPVANCTPQFFNLAGNLLFHAGKGQFGYDSADFVDSAADFARAIKSRPCCETGYNTTVDLILVGLMDCLRVMVVGSEAVQYAVGADEDMVRFLFNDCLFSVADAQALANGDLEYPPKCKRTRTRRAGFELLSALTHDSTSGTASLCALFGDLVARTQPAEHYKENPSQDARSITGYVGLQNLGCICYMNSLMQQLFMMEPIRYGVLSAIDSDENEDKTDNVLHQLQTMFGNLELSQRRAFRPSAWCHAFKDGSGQPTNVMIQQDAQEYFNMLCDRLEQNLKGKPQEKLLQQTLTGAYNSQLLCQGDCKFVRSSPEPFYNISVEVVKHKDLDDSLKHLVNGEIISDYNCEGCGRKVDVRKRVCVDKLSNNLLFHLQRFAFNFDTFQREKVNDRFEFPRHLDMYPYSTEGIAWREACEAAAEEAKSNNADTQAGAGVGAGAGEETSVPERPYTEHPKEYYEFDLVGVVVHSGTATSGHYYSFIQERGQHFRSKHPQLPADAEAAWFEFNDARVSPFDAKKNLDGECFGGKSALSWSSTQKRRSAYMLVYERSQPIAAAAPEESGGEEPAADDQMITCGKENHITLNKSIAEAIWESNSAFIHSTLVFDQEYFASVVRLAHDLGTALPANESYELVDGPLRASVELLSSFMTFGVNTLARSNDTKHFPAFAHCMEKLFRRNLAACRCFVLSACSGSQFFMDPLVKCSSASVRAAYAHLLVTCLDTLRAHETDSLFATEDVEVVVATVAEDVESSDSDEDEDTKPTDEADAEAAEPAVVEPSTITIQRPITASGRLIAYMLEISTLDEVANSWRSFGDFWTVLLGFAKLGKPQRDFLHEHDAVMKIVDLFLGVASPLQETQFKDRKRADMSSRYTRPRWHDALATVALLVQARTTEADTVFSHGPPPTCTEDAPEPLKPLCRKLLLNQNLYTFSLMRNDNPVAVAEIVKHWAWEWSDYTKSVMNVVHKGLKVVGPESAAAFFVLLDSFFSIDDSLQQARVEGLFSGEQDIMTLLKMMEVSKSDVVFECLSRLIPIMEKYPHVAEYLLESDDTAQFMERFMRSFSKAEAAKAEDADDAPDPEDDLFGNDALLRIIGMALSQGGASTVGVGTSTSLDEVAEVAKVQKADLAEKKLSLLGEVMQRHGRELLGTDGLEQAAKALAEAAAAAAAAAAAEVAEGDGDEDAEDDLGVE